MDTPAGKFPSTTILERLIQIETDLIQVIRTGSRSRTFGVLEAQLFVRQAIEELSRKRDS